MNQFSTSLLNFKLDLLSLKLFGKFVLRSFVANFVFILDRKRTKFCTHMHKRTFSSE